MMDNGYNTIRILQQNVNGSSTAHAEVLNVNHNNELDIIALQEPYIDFRGTSRASKEWISIYPSNANKEGKGKIRALMLISTKIKSDSWEEVKSESNDLTVIKLRTERGWVVICNIYSDCKNDEAINELARICRKEREEPKEFIWVGDFNRHHPMWDNPTHTHLFTNHNITRAEKLIDLVLDLGMYMSLAKETPTIEHFRTKRLSRPDNVFVSNTLEENIIRCEASPENRPNKTDHFPIQTDILLDKEIGEEKERRNWRKVDWEEFRQELDRNIDEIPKRAIANKKEAENVLDQLYKAINVTIENNVPLVKPSKFQRRWWNKEIDELIKEKTEVQKLANRRRHNPQHEIHEEVKRIRNKVAAKIDEAKKNTWEDFLEEINNKNIFVASKIVQNEPSDGTGARILPLRTRNEKGEEKEHTTNSAKAEQLYRQFFKEKPKEKELEIPARPKYKARFRFEPITKEHLRMQIDKLAPYKAPGPDGIPNILIKECKDVLIHHLLTLYRATFKLNWYPTRWKESVTVVIRKPGKENYHVPKAYRPIALLNTLAKLLSACIADMLSIEGERHGILPNTQFGGRKGKNNNGRYPIPHIPDKNSAKEKEGGRSSIFRHRSSFSQHRDRQAFTRYARLGNS